MDVATLELRTDTRGLKKGERALDSLAAKGAAAEGKVTKSMAAVSKSFARLGAAAGALAVFSAGKLFTGAIKEQELLQRNMLKTAQIIEATGGAAQRTSDQLLTSARTLARETLQSTEGIMAAQQTLLTFRNVQGDVFDGAIKAALDMSEALGTDLNSSVLQLGKALEDPITGMTALTRSGTVFTQAQKDMVRAMVEAGRTAEAQAFILGELEAQYGGVAAAAAGGLAGAQDTLSQAWQEFKIQLADTLQLGPRLEVLIQKLTATIEYLTPRLGKIVDVLSKLYSITTKLFWSLRVVFGLLDASVGKLIGWNDIALKSVNATDSAAFSMQGLNGRLSEFLGLAPSASQSTIDLSNDNYKLAQSAIAAAKAEIAKGQAMMANAQDMAGGKFTGMAAGFATAEAQNILEDGRAEMQLAQSMLTDAIMMQKEQSVVVASSVGSAMSEAATATNELNVAVETTASGIGGKMTPEVETLADKIKGELSRAVESLSGAFNDWMKSGFKDFGKFASSILNTFKNMLINMIVMAAKNKIMISLGIGGAGVGGSALAGTGGSAGGGMLSGLLGSFSGGSGILGGLGGVWSGVTGGFASGGIGGALSGGFSAIGSGISGGLAAGGIGGIGAAIGAALPIIGIGIALFSLFQKKPIISAADFRKIQRGIELTNLELLKTGDAGKRAAADLKKLAGGVKKFKSLTESYYANFFTGEEKRQKAIDSINETFSELGIEAPTTNKGFRDIVEAQNLMTKSGRKNYTALLKVSDAFASVYGTADSAANALDRLNGMNPFATLVDQKRAEAYSRNGIDYTIEDPQRIGSGYAYRGAGSRVVVQPSDDPSTTAIIEALEAGTTQTNWMLLRLSELLKKNADLQAKWEAIGMPPVRT